MRCAKKYFQSFSAYPVRLLSAAFACALAAAAHAAAPDWLDAEIKAHAQGLTELRRELHQMPELGNQEYKTQSRIIDILKASGIELNRKVLADIAVTDGATFAKLAEKAKAAQ